MNVDPELHSLIVSVFGSGLTVGVPFALQAWRVSHILGFSLVLLCSGIGTLFWSLLWPRGFIHCCSRSRRKQTTMCFLSTCATVLRCIVLSWCAAIVLLTSYSLFINYFVLYCICNCIAHTLTIVASAFW